MAATRIESRKKLKKLEKVVLHKKNKTNRNRLLAELKQCQLQPNQVDLLHSTSSMQTRGLKRFINDDNVNVPKLKNIDRAEQCLDAASLLKRKRRRRANVKNVISESSSEDTDAVSTDTEIYYDLMKKENSESGAIRPRSEEKKCTTVQAPVTKGCDREVKTKPAIYVPVSRDPKIEQARLQLPIIGEEQAIVERIRYNDVVIVSGETGSGKTTQIPQFLYEAGYTLDGSMIGITEPRRVAAVSMSERVAQELNLTSDQVSYQIRYSGNTTTRTKIKFMTDGVLLKECQQDFLLDKYSVIIIDEAHERSVFSDILIGLLSRIIPMRRKRGKPLKLVIMSATLKVDDFKKNSFLFKIEPPLISIDARQHKVTMQFSKRTPENYLKAAYQKVCSVHSKYSKNSELRGGILVFVTSKMDAIVLCKKLRAKFPLGRQATQSVESSDWSEAGSEADSADEGLISTSNPPLHCLELYALLPLEEQKRVFKDPPEGSRLCVVATNVAETSITIPNIRYVIDTGKEKTKVYDRANGFSKFVTSWISKSSAEQRMGRAGRMGPGYCHRLYSSAVFVDEFPDHATPHILQRPIEDVLLQMKSMGIDNAVNFPFPFQEIPKGLIESLITAEKKLSMLGALEHTKQSEKEFSSRLTPLGKAMANISVDPRYSKMIVESPKDILPHIVSLVSALSVREIFVDGRAAKIWAAHGSGELLGDYMAKLKAVITTINKARSSEGFSLSKHCSENGLNHKAMLEIDKLRKHLLTEVGLQRKSLKQMRRPNKEQCKFIRQLLLDSFRDHVARRLPDGFIEEKNEKGQIVKKMRRNAYDATGDTVYVGPESVLKKNRYDSVIYREIYLSADGNRRFMRDIAVVDLPRSS